MEDQNVKKNVNDASSEADIPTNGNQSDELPFDDFEENPKYQRETDRQKWEEIRSNPRVIIRDCLKRAFSETELRELCYDHFEDIHRELRDEDRHSKIVLKVMQYCDSKNRVNKLWEIIKNKNHEQYKKFYPKWHEKESANDTDSINQFVKRSEPIKHRSSATTEEEVQNHPLSGNDRVAINKWFFEKLTNQERSMVLTVALFGGINRKYMSFLSDEIKILLFEDNSKDEIQ